MINRCALPARWLVFMPMFLGMSVAQAASSAQERDRAFARLPDWTGIWEVDFGAVKAADPPAGSATKAHAGINEYIRPPFTAERERTYQQLLAGPPQPFSDCKGISFPSLMYNPGWFDVLVTPEEVAMTHTHHETRHIYIRRSHPPKEDLWPTRMGDSIGHWEGGTLVVDTVLPRGDLWLREQLPNHETRWTILSLSPEAHFVERLRRVDHDHLEDRMTVDDAIALQHPWNLVITYSRVTNVDRMIDEDCVENSRDIILKSAAGPK
jgi:hypothetical protein